MSDGGGAASQQQLHAHRAPNDVRSANDYRVQAVGIDIVTLKQRDNPARGARTQARCALAQTTHVIRVEAVNVFVRRNALEDFDIINAGGQRQLNQMPSIASSAFSVSISSSSSASLVVSGRSYERETKPTFTRFALAADINLRCRVAADQHDG